MESRLLVAVPRPLRTPLTYLAPAGAAIQAGCRVLVPLGHGSSIGVVVGPASAEPTAYRLKPVREVLDSQPLLDAPLLELLQWAARYYHYPIGEVLFAALPTVLRSGKALAHTQCWEAIPQADWETQLKRAKRQATLYAGLLAQATPCSAEQLAAQHGPQWRTAMHKLEERGWVRTVLSPPPSLAKASPDGTPRPSPHALNAEQRHCLEQCLIGCNSPNPQPILLHGVTGSGKTEIYLRLLEHVLATGQQALILVPEIGLTPQLVQRFSDHFPNQVLVCLHSGLNDSERLRAWQAASQAEAHIIIGTRSAVFTTCPALGLIIIDEEHDVSLKQQEGFRYHARDLAIKRAQLLNIPVVLGTATPALESFYNAERGRYHYLRLNQRPEHARPPTLEVQDIRDLQLRAGLTPQTLSAIGRTLERNEQVLLFINRRGFAPVLLCSACGWQAQCPACSAHTTYHARYGRLICHHCSTERPAPSQCPDCGSSQLTTQGQGTERIELMLQQQFPTTPVLRIDRDTTSRKGSLQSHLETISNTERLLLVGTQMLAKGHDFPNLTLVVILEVDQSLLSAEYHALERFGQLLTQVAGRSGRSHKAGHVILQTTQPQHPLLVTLLEQGYTGFARQLLEERRRWQLPPFSYQALIRAEAPELAQALAALQQMRTHLEAHAGLLLMGPVPAPLEKRAGRYRAQLLVQSAQRPIRHAGLLDLTGQEKNFANQKSLRWSIDIDPVELS